MSPFQVKASRMQNWSCKFTKFNDLSKFIARWKEAWESQKFARGPCRFHFVRHTGFKVKYLAEPTAPEPATSCLTGGRSNQLNYAPAKSNRQRLPVSSSALHCLPRPVCRDRG